MNKKLLAIIMVLSMITSLVLSGYSYIDKTRIVSEEETAEDTDEEAEEIADEEVSEDSEEIADEEDSDGEEYSVNGFSFLLPDSDFELEDMDEDYGYLFSANDGDCKLEFLAESFGEEELTEDLLNEVLQFTTEAITDEIVPNGKIRQNYFSINGMSSIRVSYPVYDEDFEMDYDLDMVVLLAKTAYAMILSYVPAEYADADYVRFLDEILFSVKNNEIAEEAEEAAEAPEGSYELALGETTVIENMIEITPEEIRFEEGELIPSNSEGYYWGEDDIEDETYIVVTGTIKNLGGEEIDIQFGTNNKIVVNGSYTYNGTLTAESDEHDDFFGYDIKPLKTADFVYYVSVPDELVEMYEFCEIEISFNDLINYVSSYEEPEYTLYLKCE